ncbi:MAG: carboxypeptidase-like regulatory domain-containing protein, partial [Candidatus Micrarchaeota archaeon]
MGLEDSLSEFYQNLEAGYYSICDNLKDAGIPIYDYFINPLEGKGIPSMPVALLIILLIISGGAFLLFGTQSASLKLLVVNEDGEGIDGAQVILTYNGISKEALSEDGLVLFAGLPKNKDALVAVTKEGFIGVEREITIGALPSMRIVLDSEGGVIFTIQAVDFQGTALENVQLSYTYAGKAGEEITGSAQTDPSGKAQLTVPEGAEITVIATLFNYESKTSTVVAEKGALKRIVLTRLQATPQPTPDGSHAQLEIQVKDDSDESAVDADLAIYDQDTQELLKEARTKLGSYKISDFNVGSKIKVVATAEGYEDAIKVKTLLPSTLLPIRMVKLKESALVTPSNNSIISILDETGKPLSSEIRMWEYLPESNYTLLKKVTGTQLSMQLKAERLHYATAWKIDYLPGKTSAFLGSESHNITLVKGNDENSINFTINVLDEAGAKVRGATIAFFDDLGDQAAPFDMKTDSSGKLSIRHFPKGQFTILASKSPQTGTISVDTNTVNEITIVLSAPHGVLEVSAFEWDSNTSIDEFLVEVTIQNDKTGAYYESCSASEGVCSLEVRTDKDLKVTMSAPTFESSSQNVKAIPLAVKKLKFRLVKADSSSFTKIALDRVADLNYNDSQTLTSGSYYVALLDIYISNSTDYGGSFLRLEDENGEEVAHIVNYSWEGEIPEKAIGAKDLKKTDICIPSYDSELGSRLEPLSWLDARYSFKGSSKVAYLIKIDSSISSKLLKLNFRSYAVSGDEYFRDPEDEALGSDEENLALGKEWCMADTKNASFELQTCGSLGEACCSDRPLSEGGSCNDYFQCQKSGEDTIGVCANPTACGSNAYFCTDDTECCAYGGKKLCVDSDLCSIGNFRECTPFCTDEEGFCDSSGLVNEAGTCELLGSLCGKSGLSCCEDSPKCGPGLKCSLANKCSPCGGAYQQCCPFTSENPKDACSSNLQCVNYQCVMPQLCGPTQEKCTGGTICCNEPSKRGQCTLSSECTRPVNCPICKVGQFCDSTNPNAPVCTDCIANPSACSLCSLTDPTLKCPSGICSLFPGSNLGSCVACGNQSQACCADNACSPGLACSPSNICTSCGSPGSQCCPGESCNANLTCTADNICAACGLANQVCCATDPECILPNTICSSEEGNSCQYGNRDCNSESCLSFDFEQVQCNLEGKNCAKKTGTNAFAVHSLKGCGENCSTGNLIVDYDIDNLANKYPSTLVIEISDLTSLKPLTLFSGGNKLLQLDQNSKRIRIPIPDSSWLSGKLTLQPLEPKARVIISMDFNNGNSTVSLRPFVSVIPNAAAKPPINIPNIFSCDKLTLKYNLYPGSVQPVLESSCEKIVFQVDPIFPADAIPLDDSAMGGCFASNLIFGTESEPEKYNDCFDYISPYGITPSGSPKALRYWPTKDARCPLAPVGNSVP